MIDASSPPLTSAKSGASAGSGSNRYICIRGELPSAGVSMFALSALVSGFGSTTAVAAPSVVLA